MAFEFPRPRIEATVAEENESMFEFHSVISLLTEWDEFRFVPATRAKMVDGNSTALSFSLLLSICLKAKERRKKLHQMTRIDPDTMTNRLTTEDVEDAIGMQFIPFVVGTGLRVTISDRSM